MNDELRIANGAARRAGALLLAVASMLAAGCARLQAWPVVLYNPTNGVVLIPTNFVAANLAGVAVTNTFSGTATNLADGALTQVTNISATLAQAVTNTSDLARFSAGVITNGQPSVTIGGDAIRLISMANIGFIYVTNQVGGFAGYSVAIAGNGIVFSRYDTNICQITPLGGFAGNGAGVTNLSALHLQTTNAPFDGASLKCTVIGATTNFFWQ